MSALAATERERAGDGADPIWPRLRPLDLPTLRREAEAQDLPGARDWSALVAAIRGEPGQGALLVRVLAWGLGGDDLLWWALLAARLEEALSDRPDPSRALIMAERWLRERDESVRYQVFALAQAEARPSAGTLAAYAAFTAGPSLAPQDAPAQPAPAGAARGAAQGALTASAAAPAMAATGRGFDAVALIGLEIAAGRDGRAAARRALSALAPQPQPQPEGQGA